MGDLLELTTSRNDEEKYFMISSGALKFYVKGKGRAAIKLASNPYEKICKIKIIFGNQYTWIDFENKVETSKIILEDIYKPFWISWYGPKIRIGKGDNPKPFLEEKNLLLPINCISFTSLEHHTIYWKFRLPPKIKEPVYKKISNGELKWVKMDGNCLPADALIGGYENEVLYIMRAMHEEALTPGKFVPSKGAGYVAWGYDAHKKTDMEVLCGYDGIWVKSQEDEIPQGALEGGYSEVDYETLYVGRALYNGYFIPGKVQPSHKVCYMAYRGLTILCGYDGIWVPTEGDRIPPGALVGGYTEYHETMFVGRAVHNKIVIPGKIAPSHKILCGYDGIWISTEEDKIPSGALVGGYTEYHETMYVGRAIHNKNVIPGKIAPSHKVCYIPYNGKEIFKPTYEILVTQNFSNE